MNSEDYNIVSIAVVDDDRLIREAFSMMIDGFGDARVILQAGSGKDLIGQLRKGLLPDLVLLDINMKIMNGYQTAKWLYENYPDVRVLVLTVHNPEPISLAIFGVRGILRKDIDKNDLHTAIRKIMNGAYLYPENILFRLLQQANLRVPLAKTTLLSEKEALFLALACTEMTYKEIALVMEASIRTVDGYRDSLFTKLGVKSRVGIVLYAIKNGIMEVG